MTPLELWGGVECTVNRVEDVYFDQVRRSGHHDRPEDIALFAALGVRAMRYPVLWERVAPHGLDRADWRWTDERLELLRQHDVRPIATLLHHGSGPRDTSLLDPAFPERFADYARLVAERYPWVTDYTPVNEPLTTARFSALYGHWYPHARDDRSFVRALLNELRATALAMRRIREITPRARLVPTEDTGLVSSTPMLAYQAAFENHRRWLTFDMLCGKVDERHPLWSWLIGCGATAHELAWFRDHPSPPDIIGLNYYLTSDRFLDHRLSQYPDRPHPGNGRDQYIDMEAVRVPDHPRPSHHRVLEEAWERYGIPVALTEVHAGCTREEQLRWFASAWRGAEAARRNGAEVIAVTAWALLGSYDWNSLVTRSAGVYEPGAFDVRSNPPRITAVGQLMAALAADTPHTPLADQDGWWARTTCIDPDRHFIARRLSPAHSPAAPLLIVGATGTLGRAITRACAVRGIHAVAASRHNLDVTNAADIARALLKLRPWAVVNAAGYAPIDEAETNQDACWRLNTVAAEALAAAAAAFSTRLLWFSTDLVFDGGKNAPYVESDPAAPLNEYGRSKAAAEQRVTRQYAEALIIRTSAFFSPDAPGNFLTRALREISGSRKIASAVDVVVSPTYVPHLADHALDLLIDGERGVWHLANRGAVSWAEFAMMGARAAGLDESLVEPVPCSRLGLAARRPHFSALGSERGQIMPSLEQAIADYMTASDSVWRERRRSDRSCAG